MRPWLTVHRGTVLIRLWQVAEVDVQSDEIVDSKNVDPSIDVLVKRAPKPVAESRIEVSEVVLINMRCGRSHGDQRDFAKTVA